MSPKSAHNGLRPRLALIASSIASILIGSFASGCATPSSTKEIQRVTATAASLKAEVPPKLREPCSGAPLPPDSAGEEDYQVFGIRQTVKLEQCEFKRALGEAALDLHNAWVDVLVDRMQPPTLWQRVTGRRPVQPPKPSLEEYLGRRENAPP